MPLRPAVCKHHRFHLILRQPDADMEIGDNLAAQFAHAPRPPDTFRFVEKAYQRVVHREQFPDMRKGKRRNQLFRRCTECFGQLVRILPANGRTMKPTQFVRQCRTNCRCRRIMRRCRIIRGNQRTDMGIIPVKQSRELEKSDIQPFLPDMLFQTFQQPVAVFGPVAAVLFVFNDITPDDPIPQRDCLIDGLDRQSPHRIVNGHDILSQLLKGHALHRICRLFHIYL